MKAFINNTLKEGEKSSLLCKKSFWMHSKCEICGTEYLHRTTCKKEDCVECGQVNSYAHFRRYARGISRVLWLWEEKKGIGYMVITFPLKEREKLKEKENLKKVERYIIRLLKRELKDVKGIARWHFAGEKSKKWHPHLNILIGLTYIEKNKLKRVKDLIEKKTKSKVINYNYSRDIKKVLHYWRYITRPTFLLQNEVDYSKIKGMKNIIYIGNWREYKENIKQKDRIEWLKYVKKLFEKGYFGKEKKDYKFMNLFIILHNRCVLCGEKLKFKKLNILDEINLEFEQKKRNVYLGLNYYLIINE